MRQITGATDTDRAWLDRAIAFLREREAQNTIQLGSLVTLDLDQPERPLLLVATSDDAIVAVAARTPPFNLLLSQQRGPEGVRAIARYLRAANEHIPGVMAEAEVVAAFVEAWTDSGEVETSDGMRSQILACESVIEPEGVPGRFRIATEADWPGVEPWLTGFFVEVYEATPDEVREQTAHLVRRLRPPGGIGLWEDDAGEIVALAGFKDATGRAMRIGPVFVPMDRRGNGYGKAVSAATTGYILATGCTSVCLYTDAANPVSNHVYRAIGYRHVVDSRTVRFAYNDR